MEDNELLLELSSLENIEDRKLMIVSDLKSGNHKFKNIAKNQPFNFFKLLGGDEDELVPTHNWAYKFTYADYLECNPEIIYSAEEEKKWDLEQKSIENAYYADNYYSTCTVDLIVIDGSKLRFVFDFREGYLLDCLATPYDVGDKELTFGYLLLE